MQRTKQIGRYLISGGISVLILLTTLTLLHELLQLHIIASSVIAYMTSTICAFMLQKHWTWNDTSNTKKNRQFVLYSTIALLGIGLNTILMHYLVVIHKIWYIPAQFMAIAIIVTGNFFLYDRFVFLQKK